MHVRDGDPIGDPVAHERLRAMLTDMDWPRILVDGVAGSGTNLLMFAFNHLRDNHLLTTCV